MTTTLLPSPTMPRGGARPGAGRKGLPGGRLTKCYSMTDAHDAELERYAERNGIADLSKALRALLADEDRRRARRTGTGPVVQSPPLTGVGVTRCYSMTQTEVDILELYRAERGLPSASAAFCSLLEDEAKRVARRASRG